MSSIKSIVTFKKSLQQWLLESDLHCSIQILEYEEYTMMIKGFVTLAWCRYLVHANGICAGYSLLSAAIVAMPHPSTMSRAWTFFLLDQVTILSLLLSLLIYLDINIFQLRPTLLIINKGTIYQNYLQLRDNFKCIMLHVSCW